MSFSAASKPNSHSVSLAAEVSLLLLAPYSGGGARVANGAEATGCSTAAGMTDVDGIRNRACRAAVGGYRLGAGMYVHPVSIQLNGRSDLVSVGANHRHVGLVRRQDVDLAEGSTVSGGDRNRVAGYGYGG